MWLLEDRQLNKILLFSDYATGKSIITFHCN